MKFPIRDLDSMQVTVLVDNSASGRGMLATHGLSMLIRTKWEGRVSTVLFDVGPDPELLTNNMDRLGVDPRSVDCIVLSHSHHDHAEALPETVRRIGKKDLPVFVHPDAFRISMAYRPNPGLISTLGRDRNAVTEAGGMFIPVSEPMEVVPGLFTSGTVARETGEPTGIESVTVSADGTWHDDPILDDMSLACRVKDKGLCILTGCSHAGIVNIVRHCTRISETTQIALIMGGFHLIGADEKRISWTVNEFSGYHPGLLVSGHCTGFEAEARMYQAFGKTYHHIYTGKVVSI